MSDPPPAKRLKQSTILESLSKQRSIQENSDTGTDPETSKTMSKPTVDAQSSPKRSLRNRQGNQADVNRELMATAAENRAKQSSDDQRAVPGSSKVADCPAGGDEPMSQGSMTSSLDQDAFDSPLLFSDSDLEDIAEPPTASGKSTKSHLGTNISEMRTTPGCLPPLGDLVDTPNHKVLIKTPYKSGEEPVAHPATYTDKWDADHAKLPCSPENLYPVQNKGGSKTLNSRWELIQTALLTDMSSSLDLEEAILTYNTRYSDKWNFQDLHAFFTEALESEEVNAFFKNTLPKMVELALQLPEICTRAIPMLKKKKNHSVTLSQRQIASLLANAFFCTFPRRNTARRQSEYSLYPDINFSRLFQSMRNTRRHVKQEKLKCILNYFRRVTNKMPNGTVTFQRQCVTDFPDWSASCNSLRKLHVAATGTIEDDGRGMLQVDFANKYLGGGVLGHGCVQEEIRFLICPELILSRLFTEELDRNECLIVTGFETYSDYSGYAGTFRWDGNHIDSTPRDSWGRRCTELVAIDALVFRSYVDQFHENLVRRELNKAYSGFLRFGVPSEQLSAVATGNWGCGAFGGDLRLKSLIQIMAASEAGRDICYFTFDNYELMHDLFALHEFLSEKKLAICDIYGMILQYNDNVCRRSSRTKKPSTNLYDYIYNMFRDGGDDTDTTDQGDDIDVDEDSQEARCNWQTSDSPDYAANTP